MNIRKAGVALAAATAIAGFAGVAALIAPGVAGADPISSSGTTVQAALPINPDPNTGFTVTPGTPFSSGQTIEVSIPAETVLSQSGKIQIVECADPGGAPANLPTSAASCDPGGTINGDAFSIGGGFSDPSLGTTTPGTPPAVPNGGSFTYTNYPLYAENPSEGSPITCGTAAIPCVLLITTNYSDIGGTGHLWSQPFQVVDKDGVNGGTDPGDGTPEVPLAVGLPLSAAGLFGGGLALRRRRRSGNAPA